MAYESTRKSSRLIRRLRDARGQSVVELAVALPVFLLILLGVMDFGKALNYWITETQVSAEGARRAAVNCAPTTGGCGTGSASLQNYVKSQIKIGELKNGASICVSFDGTVDQKKVGHPVKVTVSTSYNWLPFLERFGGIGRITLRDSSTMRLEAPSTANSSDDIKPGGQPC
jgi:hypothetical protein